ncbi:hypothetical protein E2C01_071517 [Portunus trituberculatus]|uniref:Uncharacterized protein n=1 Tax=Portunus trituberculatus TaxID=210409 RepID=A0A5B7I452_PORTR|nr:hypothetical protein [Portunus trituberculatus]
MFKSRVLCAVGGAAVFGWLGYTGNTRLPSPYTPPPPPDRYSWPRDLLTVAVVRLRVLYCMIQPPRWRLMTSVVRCLQSARPSPYRRRVTAANHLIERRLYCCGTYLARGLTRWPRHVCDGLPSRQSLCVDCSAVCFLSFDINKSYHA